MCIEDLRRIARRNVPGVFFEYMEAGSYSEHTRDANVDDMRAIKLRQRVLVDMSQRQPENHGARRGACAAARDCADRSLRHAACRRRDPRLPRRACGGHPVHALHHVDLFDQGDITEAVKKPFWFQLYVMRDRGFVKALIERAEKAGCSALFVTVDLPVNGQRHVDMRNGLWVQPRLTARTVFDVLRRPTWAWRILNGKRRTFANVDGHLPGGPRLRRDDACRMDAQPVRRDGELEGTSRGSARSGRTNSCSRASSIRKMRARR